MRTRLLVAAALIAGAAPVLAARPAAATTPIPGFASLVVEINSLDQPLIYLGNSVTGGDLLTPPAVTASRVAKGRYSFTIDQLNLTKGSVHLTQLHEPTDAANDPICTIRSVYVYSTKTKVTVNCFDPVTGKPASGTHFELFYSTYRFNTGAFLTVQTSSLYSHTPSSRYRSDGLADRVRIRRTSKGSYEVWVPKGAYLFDGLPAVTAISSSARWCNIVDAGPEGADWSAIVQCRRVGGSLADSRFAITVSDNNPFNLTTAPAAASQLVAVWPGNPPQQLIFLGYNSAGGQNWAGWDPNQHLTVATFFSVPNVNSPRSVILTASTETARCAHDFTPVPSPFRHVVVRCIDPLGNPIPAVFTVMDTTLDGSF